MLVVGKPTGGDSLARVVVAAVVRSVHAVEFTDQKSIRIEGHGDGYHFSSSRRKISEGVKDE